MFYPFLVADHRSGLQYRLTDTGLAELSLAPVAPEWGPGRAIIDAPDPVWRESVANAPVETISALSVALEDLVLATGNLRVPVAGGLPDSRARRHLEALIGLWRRMGDALPEGLAPVRHVLELAQGRFLDPLPVVEGSLDPFAPAAMRALYARLEQEFGTVPAPARGRAAPEGSRLHAVQGGVAAPELAIGEADGSLAFFGVRDLVLQLRIPVISDSSLSERTGGLRHGCFGLGGIAFRLARGARKHENLYRPRVQEAGAARVRGGFH